MTATLQSEQYRSLFAFSSSVSVAVQVLLTMEMQDFLMFLVDDSEISTLFFTARTVDTVAAAVIADVTVVLSVLSELALMVFVVMEVKIVFALSLVATHFCLFFMASSALSFLACLVPL